MKHRRIAKKTRSPERQLSRGEKVERERPRNGGVTMREIARLAGVSKMTVSRALSKSELVVPQTRKKILKIAEDLGYVPDATSALFHSGRSSIVAALIPEINGSVFPDVLRGLWDALKESEFQLIIGNTGFDTDREEAIVEAMLRRRPEGVVLTGETHTVRTVRLLKASNIPVIETWDIPKRPIDQVVGVLDVEAASAMTHHLASRGYRRIGFVSSGERQLSRMRKRQEGYKTAMKELGFTELRIVEHGGLPMSMQDGADAIGLMLNRWPDVEAVFFAADSAAFGALMECHRRGLRVPQDIAIAGFGNFEVSRCCHPRLTSVAVNPYNVGLFAGKLLLSERESKLSPKQKPIVLDFEICQREST